MRRLQSALLAATLIVSGPLLVAQSGNDLFQKALAKERAEGRLDEAIQIYDRVVRESGADRALAAKALLQMGQCYERLGRNEAQKTYERLLRDYGDQRAVAEEARIRLTTLSRANAASTGVRVRRVWSGDEYDTQGMVSPNGRYLSYIDRKTQDLAVRDLVTGRTMRLTEGDITAPGETAMRSIFARDGRQVAYTWFGKDGMFELRVARIDRPHGRLVYRNPDVGYVEPLAWSEDGQRIIAGFERNDGTVQLAAVSVADGTARVLKSFNWVWPAGLSISPDGRFIAYAIPPPERGVKHDLFLLATDGSREVPLVQHPANDTYPLWAPDGSGVIFVSDRSGSLDAWLAPVVDGRSHGTAMLVKQNLGRGRPLGITHDGALYYGATVHSVDVYVGAIDSQSGRATAGTIPVSERFVGSNSAPDWSPDGTRLLYVSQRGLAGPASSTIVIRSMADATERELVPQLQYFHRPRWAPDGRAIVVQGRGLRGPTGLFRVDVDSGQLDVLVRSDTGSFAAHQAWSPDGKTVFYTAHDPTDGRIVARDFATGVEREVYRPFGGGDKAVSPDGQSLAFVSVDPAAKSTSIRIVPTAGGSARAVITLGNPERVGYFGGLSWTPDSTRLLFVKEAGKAGELWQVDGQTGRSEPTGLSVPGLQYVRLAPDGRRLAYSAGRRQEEVWVIEHFLPANQTRPFTAARRSPRSH